MRFLLDKIERIIFIYKGAEDWCYKHGTSIEGKVTLPNSNAVDAEEAQDPVSDEIYYIVPDKFKECESFHDKPQCAAVCNSRLLYT